jgi:hypothetical protein
MRTEQPQDKLTRREMLRLSAAGMAALQVPAPFAPAVTRVDTAHHFEPIPDERTFNLVPGSEAVPLIVRIQPGNEVAMRIQAGGDSIAGSNA